MGRVVGKAKRNARRCPGCNRKLGRLLRQLRLFSAGTDRVCPVCWFVVKKDKEITECEAAKSNLR